VLSIRAQRHIPAGQEVTIRYRWEVPTQAARTACVYPVVVVVLLARDAGACYIG
jgi:hypothetical protein